MLLLSNGVVQMPDIALYLLVVCGPILAVGVAVGIAKPIGRWFGRWLDVDRPETLDEGGRSLDSRIALLEQAVSEIADDLDRVLALQRETEALKLLARSSTSNDPES